MYSQSLQIIELESIKFSKIEIEIWSWFSFSVCEKHIFVINAWLPQQPIEQMVEYLQNYQYNLLTLRNFKIKIIIGDVCWHE